MKTKGQYLHELEVLMRSIPGNTTMILKYVSDSYDEIVEGIPEERHKFTPVGGLSNREWTSTLAIQKWKQRFLNK